MTITLQSLADAWIKIGKGLLWAYGEHHKRYIHGVNCYREEH